MTTIVNAKLTLLYKEFYHVTLKNSSLYSINIIIHVCVFGDPGRHVEVSFKITVHGTLTYDMILQVPMLCRGL